MAAATYFLFEIRVKSLETGYELRVYVPKRYILPIATENDLRMSKRNGGIDEDKATSTSRKTLKMDARNKTYQYQSCNDYTVGWICVLPKELTAATAMLDQIHLDLPKPPNDPNTYTLGSIGEHKIVTAWLPRGGPAQF